MVSGFKFKVVRDIEIIIHHNQAITNQGQQPFRNPCRFRPLIPRLESLKFKRFLSYAFISAFHTPSTVQHSTGPFSAKITTLSPEEILVNNKL